MTARRHLRIAVMTSGGDAPGMNACLRAIVKGARSRMIEVMGIRFGGVGLLRGLDDDLIPLHPEDVSGTINVSGTILKTTREEQVTAFLSTIPSVSKLRVEPGRLLQSPGVRQLIGERARDTLGKHNIQAMVMIGGDQTCRAALAVSHAYGDRFPIVVVPATIDNDVAETDLTIGFDSAVSSAVQAIDAIRASAQSHSRVFIVEVMGRTQGHIAVEVGVACGAEEVLVPERHYDLSDIDEMTERLRAARERGQDSSIIVVAEGVDSEPWGLPQEGRTSAGLSLERVLRLKMPDVELRLAILGHLQRGAPPTPSTRNLATRFGLRALDRLTVMAGSRGKSPQLVRLKNGRVSFTFLSGDMVRRSRRSVLALQEECMALAY